MSSSPDTRANTRHWIQARVDSRERRSRGWRARCSFDGELTHAFKPVELGVAGMGAHGRSVLDCKAFVKIPLTAASIAPMNVSAKPHVVYDRSPYALVVTLIARLTVGDYDVRKYHPNHDRKQGCYLSETEPRARQGCR
jgi:hypothetical protein